VTNKKNLFQRNSKPEIFHNFGHHHPYFTVFDTTYALLKTIVQILRVQKLLVFYFLDYPTKVTSSFNNKKNTFDSILCSKESLKTHMIGQ
jgi:hypothetical protein